jgi:hypothetical protein
VSRNTDKSVVAATVNWQPEKSKLALVYYIDRTPDEESEQRCELALADLIAEFREIKFASSECVHVVEPSTAKTLKGLVYLRD